MKNVFKKSPAIAILAHRQLQQSSSKICAHHKIWIQYDDTEEGIATDLLQAGVTKGRYSSRLSPY
ncbi:MAG TPA: element excision factor XisI family protein [Leptolyngbyaceae cyanobacterium]